MWTPLHWLTFAAVFSFPRHSHPKRAINRSSLLPTSKTSLPTSRITSLPTSRKPSPLISRTTSKPTSKTTALPTKRTVLPTYDYIVVGSGPGGGPVAANLAIAGYKVLLIDAGDDHGTTYEYQVPALQLQSTEDDRTKWDYFVNHYSNLTRAKKDSKMTYRLPDGTKYVGQNPPAGATPLGILYPRAGALGGCAAHNALITIYPHDSDWTNIQTITGDASWSPTNMRNYFTKVERCGYLPNGAAGHGFSGWLGTELTDLSLVVKDPKLLSVILSGATAMGKNVLGLLVNTVLGLAGVLIQDINAPGQSSIPGVYQVPLAASGGARNSPREFILRTANAVNADGSKKYHLDIQLNTLVTKVRFVQNGSTPVAVGVDFLQGQSLYRADPRSASATASGSGSVNATREVILSAGAFNTPQLLKLSGIGPAAELTKWNIPVLVNLPGVGTNLQDRYETTVISKSTSDFIVTKDCTFLSKLPDPCLTQWVNGNTASAKGIYASSGVAVAVVMKTSVAEGEPDVLVSGAPVQFTGYYPGYSKTAEVDARHWVWITLKGHSRNNAGRVTLRSANPLDTPVINFNYFDSGVTANDAAAKDLQAVYEGMQFSRAAFQDLVPLDGSFSENWPGTNISSEANLKQFIQDEAWGHHASCTCPIGADNDPMAVLDSSFRVRGTQGLRVVDASVFPKIPGFYISLPVYIISQKASEVIIADAVKAG
ncbi:hypothetical protein BP6252_13852 [Coleophoma cylindrospora]|uniref:Glucose-methanol-choline oxidoreductase N-terminal domain-containing protein n=1 Tax=Coleophoma cylindrospora TaxID=1849047 RepID=A0A3D8Q5L0_9HELO|nr:hypothetical protein BP6252_13852 [Coleophoma cylindrospora]